MKNRGSRERKTISRLDMFHGGAAIGWGEQTGFGPQWCSIGWRESTHLIYSPP